MDASQIINKYDNISDVIFILNRNEMDNLKIKNKIKCKIILRKRVRYWFYD